MEKLASLGINSTAGDFLTSTNAMVIYLKKKNYKKIYAFGTSSFVSQLESAGLNITTGLCDDIDCLCIGFDTELTFKKLEDACILLGRSVDYVATNPDWVCPTWYGFVPDCGSVCEMLYNATKKRPRFIGKPQPEMALFAMEMTGFDKSQTAIIGDRLYTDIACGVNAGISSIFVLSGEGTLSDIEKSTVKPQHVYDNIRSILNDLKAE